jgi:histone acetyltransferase (RNA polymerase elongator complex component)
MEKELKNGKIEIVKRFYGRLYGKYSIYSSQQKALKDEPRKIIKKDNDIKTLIVGKDPDIKSFRNFVSLDTRSREIRHQEVKSKKTANIIIRKYISSGGVEYFISFEDQLGYLYGFTRLLLPNEKDTIQIP